MSKYVDLNSLPYDIKSQIPLSIRIRGPVLDYDSLPDDIQVLVYNYVYEDKEYSKQDIYDFSSEVSEELQTAKPIYNAKQLVIEYLRTIINTPIDSIPNDPYFGSNIKKYLHLKDSEVIKTYLSSEINDIIQSLINLGIPVKLSKLILKPTSTGIDYGYQAECYLKVEEQEIKITIAP